MNILQPPESPSHSCPHTLGECDCDGQCNMVSDSFEDQFRLPTLYAIQLHHVIDLFSKES